MKTKKLVLGGLMIALGVLLPQAFHIFGPKVSQVLSPMHIPVFIGGLFLGPIYGAIIGVCTPFLSSLITGMPPFPMNVFMAFELMAYGLFSGLFVKLLHKVKGNLYISLGLSMLIGRVVYAIAIFVASNFFNATGINPFSIFVKLTTFMGLLAIIIQFVFVPPIVMALQKIDRS
jgi:uncharacterized membrane protein